MVERARRFFRWSDASVRARMLAIVGLLVVSLTLVGAFAVTGLNIQANTVNELAQASLAQHLQQDADMRHDALRASVFAAALSDVRGKADLDATLESLRDDSQRFRDNLDELNKLAVTPDVRASLARTRPLAEAYIVAAGEIAEQFRSDRVGALARLGDFDRAFDGLRVEMEAQTILIKTRIDRANAQAAAIGTTAKTRITFAVVGLSVLAAFVVWALATSVRRTLRRVRDVATAMANGNLSIRNMSSTNDELGELSNAMDRMADSLNEMITRLRADADRDAFGSQLIEALEMVDTEREVHAAVARAMTVISADRPMELLLADSSRAQLERATEHASAGAPGCGVESPFSCIAVRRGTAVSFADSESLNACPRLRDRPCGSVSAVCVPVGFMGRSLGVLHTSGPVNQLPTPEQIGQLTTLGIQAGARIGTVRAFERTQIQAATDSLTGLSNRRAIEEAARNLAMQKKDYAVVLADLDHFKKLNDTYGHGAGDNALRVFADALRAVTRDEDHPARWGGEEFAIVMPGATAEMALKVLERLRDRLVPAIKAAGARPFTASFGIADTSMSTRFDELVRIADEALYRSKGAGRDRATVGDVTFGSGPRQRESDQAARINVSALVATG